MPALLGHRAVNTLDAMVGHRSRRYRHFGWASARLDDVANLPGSRVSAALAVALGGAPASAWAAWRRDAGGHPSPNAGPVEAAFAGSLGVRLGGRNVYGSAADPHVEHRAVLGTGRPVVPTDIGRARALAARVDAGATGLAVMVALLRARRPSRRQQQAR
jgi:adenosylcobinamide-phosphate synthase